MKRVLLVLALAPWLIAAACLPGGPSVVTVQRIVLEDLWAQANYYRGYVTALCRHEKLPEALCEEGQRAWAIIESARVRIEMDAEQSKAIARDDMARVLGALGRLARLAL